MDETIEFGSGAGNVSLADLAIVAAVLVAFAAFLWYAFRRPRP